MKTSCKRIVSFILVLMTIVGCCVPALAADTNCKHDNPEHQTFIKEIEATCKTDGYKQYRCEDCNTVYLDEDSITPATGKHTYSRVEEVTNCEGDWIANDPLTDVNKNGVYDDGDRRQIGTAHYKCSVCGDKKLITGSTSLLIEAVYIYHGQAAAHQWTYEAADGKAYDCSKDDGKKVCSICKKEDSTFDGVAIEGDGKHHVTATKDNGHGGTQTYCIICKKGGEVLHKFVGSIKVAPKDCKAGVMVFACVCGKSYEEVIPATTSIHKDAYLKEVDAQALTCTQDGWTGRYDCTNCGTTYVKYITKDAAHNHKTNGAYDGDDDTIFNDPTDKKDPSCEKDGYEKYAVCKDCDFTVSYYNNKWNAGKKVLAKTEHAEKPGTWATRANCSTQTNGKVQVLCTNSNCDKNGVVEAARTIPYTHDWAHEYTIHTQNTTANCQQYGVDTMICVWCKNEKITYTDKTDHDWGGVLTPSAATCTKDGFKANVKQCSVCKVYSDPSAVIPKLNHITSTKYQGVAATCTTSGWFICERGVNCDQSYDPAGAIGNQTGAKGCVEIKALDHNWVATKKPVAGKEATCVSVAEYGYGCSRCDAAVMSGNDFTPAKKILSGDAYDPNNHLTLSTSTNPATCITTGTVTKKCPNCTYESSSVLPMINGVKSTDAKLTKGYIKYDDLVEALKAANLSTDVTSVEAIEWMYDNGYNGYEIVPSCEVKGSKTYICNLIYNGKHHTHVEVGNYAHDDTTGAYTDATRYDITTAAPPTCTKPGSTRIVKCKTCKGTLVAGETIPAIHTAIASLEFETATTDIKNNVITIYADPVKGTWSTTAPATTAVKTATFTYDVGKSAACHDTTGKSVTGTYAHIYCDECYEPQSPSNLTGTKVTFKWASKKYSATTSLKYTVAYNWITLNYAAHCPVYNCTTCLKDNAQSALQGQLCSGDGYKSARKCSACDKYDFDLADVTGTNKDSARIDFVAHGIYTKHLKGNITTTAAVVATCYSPAYTAGAKCSTCGVIDAVTYVDVNHNNKEDSGDYAAHNPGTGVVIAATCTTPAYTYTACTMCEAACAVTTSNKLATVDGEITAFTAPVGHKNAEGYLLVEGWYCSASELTQKISDSVKKNGYFDWKAEDFVCATCHLGREGQVATGEIIVGKKNPFTPVHETVTVGASKPATCVSNGYTISICDFCKTNDTQILMKDENAHVFGATKEVEASYTEAAKIVQICEYCDKVEVVKTLDAKKTAFEVRLEVFNPYSDDMKFVKSGIIGVRVILVTKDGGEFDITAAQVTFPVSENLIYRDVKYGEAFTTDNSLITANIKANTMVGKDDCIFLMNMLNDADGNVITTTVSGEFTLGEVYFVISDGLREIPKGGQFDVDLSVGDDMVVIDVPTIDGKSTIVLDDNYDATTKTYGSYGVNTEVSKMDAIDVGYLGDANGDNVVNGQDSQRLAALIRRNGYEAALDINKDSVCNTTDLTLLQANIVGALSDMNFCNQGLSEDEAWLIKK